MNGIYAWLMHYGDLVIRKTRKMPLFTNNAQSFYKPHSLAPGGIGTVKNYRRKAIKT